jgi:hypothetical protein
MGMENRLPGLVVAIVLAACLAGCGMSGRSESSPQSSAPASAPTAFAAPAVPFADAKFSFAAVTGAPAQVLATLSAQLGQEAFTQKVTLVPSGDPTATYVIKGYLSAVGDTSGTILVYVWDVFDTSGKRVHRISGQETSVKGSQDPWSGVDKDTTLNVARRTIGALVLWGTPTT